MAASVDKSGNLDQRRLDLERDIEKLEKSIRFWRTSEAEYEGFKEEIQKLKPDATPHEIRALAKDFGGDILTSKECNDILESSTGAQRDVKQISNILSRRLDYVQENVKTIQKQLSAAESRIAALGSIIEIQPRDEDGLPLQEITELLDDDDNVISGNVVDTNSVAPEILDHLRKSGVKGLPNANVGTQTKSTDVSTTAEHLSVPGPSKGSALARSDAALQRPLDSAKTKHASSQHSERLEIEEAPEDTPMEDVVTTKPTTVHEDVVQSLNKDLTNSSTFPPNESPEDVALRREMLEYNMNEVGAVVATMNLNQGDLADEDGQSDDDDDEFEEEDFYSNDDSDDLEDEHGRTTVRVIDDEYRQEMLELEARLNARAMINVGRAIPKHPNVDREENLPSDDDVAQSSPPKPSGTKKKGVRFAESLDIAEPPPAAARDTDVTLPDSVERPVVDTIVERSSPATSDLAPATTKKYVSRFSATRSKAGNELSGNPTTSKTQAISSGPLAGMDGSMLAPVSGMKSESSSRSPDSGKATPNPILADTLVERSVGEDGEISALAPDEYDPQIMNQQIATEYHRMRNRFIRRNGGVVNRDGPSDDEAREDENGRKISRFKAAKISQIRR